MSICLKIVTKTQQMKKIFAILAFTIVTSQQLIAQSISYYPFNSQLAVSSNPTNMAWAEVRMQMNSATSALTSEFGPMLTVYKTKDALFYTGGGVNIGWMSNVFNQSSILKGFYGSVGVRAYPFTSLPHLGLNFEFTPYTDSKVKTGLLRAWLGINYHFGKNKLK
jgi:hypothetical protein